MSGFMSALRKFFTKDRVIISVFFILVAVFLLYYSSGKITMMDTMEDGTEEKEKEAMSHPFVGPEPAKEPFTEAGSSYSNKAVNNPSELLPKDDNSQWASINPSSQNAPNTPDLLQAGYHIGLDTVGQTLKNPNLQLRSDPVITKADVGPWNNSTVEPDLIRLPLEVSSTFNK
jgi:hypothetical protein